MTPPRHGSDAGQDGPYEPGGFEAAVDHLADPLNDPLPGRHASPWSRPEHAPAGQAAGDAGGAGGPGVGTVPSRASHGPQTAQDPPREWYDPEGYERDWYGRQEPAQEVPAAPVVPGPRADETVTLRRAEPRRVVVADQAATVALPVTALRPGPERESGAAAAWEAAERDAAGPDTAGPDAAERDAAGPDASAPVTGGRAERRRAAKGRGRRRGDGQPEAAMAAGARGADATPPKPMSRVEARRAAKAAKDSPAVVVSRVVGELFISLGVLMLLFVTYQLWWTNVRADQIAGKETHKIQDDWAKGKRSPGVFAPGEGFAIIHIPKLDVVTPIAEGISKEKVLDRGMVGHYGEEPLRTAMPSDKQGNFALAGHRNTHGEPFRYVNRLSPGDPIVVETQDAYYTYEMTSVLPQTSPSNVSVIGAVPPQSGFKKPGRYITLTTCTPEFTSTYRLIVWGKMVDERPRSEGKPDALLD
ncbi:class E sortase [Streptomyces sp. NPDC048332]|uniref:class E sortase n=1 Tax=Streptomyces sp. NPDC048332 TaxID=3154619 RepID=UPI00343F43E4